MDMIMKLGGRKFLMALITIGAAMYLECSGHGLSTQMAGFLVGVVGTFSVANYAASKTFMENKPTGGSSDGAIHKKLDNIQDVISEGFSPEAIGNLTTLLSNIQDNINGVKQTQMQVAQALGTLARRQG